MQVQEKNYAVGTTEKRRNQAANFQEDLSRLLALAKNAKSRLFKIRGILISSIPSEEKKDKPRASDYLFSRLELIISEISGTLREASEELNDIMKAIA